MSPADRRLPDIPSALARQAFDAVEILLGGFVAAEERDGTQLLRQVLDRSDEHLYAGLVTVVLRLVFLSHCEDRGVPVLTEGNTLGALFDALHADALHAESAANPPALCLRFDAYSRLVRMFRVVASRASKTGGGGDLFDPDAFPFLEGRNVSAAGASDVNPAQLPAAPRVDDAAVYQVLEKILLVGGQRVSYRALDVEQMGTIYEALMGFSVRRLDGPAVRLRLGGKRGAVWVELATLLALSPSSRERWLREHHGFEKQRRIRISAAAKGATSIEELLRVLGPCSGKTLPRAEAGAIVLEPGRDRRRTSSHYTPRELTEPIVTATLAPILRVLGEAPSSEDLLRLVVCDPAAGTGAFLLSACRCLSDHVVAAWTRESVSDRAAMDPDATVSRARKLVATRCLYGVDKNLAAIQIARLSLWLLAMAPAEPLTFVDHALRHGDSLVGLGMKELRAFHWKPEAPVPILAAILEDASWEESRDRARLFGDLVVGAFFGQTSEKAREVERTRRLARVAAWLLAERDGDHETAEEVLSELRGMQDALRQEQVPFHWAIEFPSVFMGERRAAAKELSSAPPSLIAIVGNPPFLGGKRISTEHGVSYAEWLTTFYDATKNTDLAAHFFLRAERLLGESGTIGLIATNSVAQGDTRRAGLMRLVSRGLCIYEATRSLKWPGDAMVSVAVVHLAKGAPARVWNLAPRLDGRKVNAISSLLRPMEERPEPRVLRANKDRCFIGCFLRGEGFILSEEERQALLAREPSAASYVRPFLGGDEVNSSPTHSAHRYVINLGDRTLAEAGRTPELLGLLATRVKPSRERLRTTGTDAGHRARWWLFANSRPELHQAIAGRARCLVNPRVSKHLSFAFQPTDRTFSDQLCVFRFDHMTSLAVLQSRIHEVWARLLSSTLGEGLRYAPSDCFETFPFPSVDPDAEIPALQAIGQRLYEARARFMIETGHGLTRTYNALKDPLQSTPPIRAIRALHEAMDRAVLEAYGWSDVVVPPWGGPPEEAREAQQAFADTVIQRLFALNAERAEDERKTR